MGRGMARDCSCGHELTGYNGAAPRRDFARPGAALQGTDRGARSEVVITMLADDAAVEAVWIDAAAARMRLPASIQNMATSSVKGPGN